MPATVCCCCAKISDTTGWSKSEAIAYMCMIPTLYCVVFTFQECLVSNTFVDVFFYNCVSALQSAACAATEAAFVVS